MTNLRSSLSFLALSALASACSSSDDATRLVPPGAGEVPGEPSRPAPAGAEPGSDEALTVMSRVCTPEGCNHYLYFMRELPADGVLDRSLGLELGDTQAAIHEGALYVFDRSGGTVTRWTVDGDLVPSRGETLSFQTAGVTQLDAIANVFVSRTRAFMLDSTAGVLVSWDPSAMRILATTPLPDAILTRANAPIYALWPVAAGGRVYYSASWYDYDNRRGYERAALLSFASDVDAPSLEVLEDDRCGITSSVAPFVDERGDVYFAGDWYIGLQQIGVSSGQAQTPACLLRVAGGTGRVDPSYYVDLLRAADARALTGAFYMGEGRWLMNVWPNSVPPLSAADIEANPEAYLGARNFEYVVIVDLNTGTRVPVSGISRGSYGGLTPMYLDGLPLIQTFGGDDPETGAVIYEVRPTGETRRVLQAGPNGDIEFVGRLR